MSQQQIIFSKNTLSAIANDNGYPYAPGTSISVVGAEGKTQKAPDWNGGQIYFATKDAPSAISMSIDGTDVLVGYHKAYIYLDDGENQRYLVSSPVDWSEVLNRPLDEDIMSYKDTTTDAHTITFKNLVGGEKTWTENDHYPTAFTWIAGAASGPTATITMYKNEAVDTPISIAAIPSASTSASGIVTTGIQSFSGTKTFTGVIIGTKGNTDPTTLLKVYGSINIGNDRVNLQYNESTQSLDFIFT